MKDDSPLGKIAGSIGTLIGVWVVRGHHWWWGLIILVALCLAYVACNAYIKWDEHRDRFFQG